MNCQALILDIDGTLWDTRSLVAEGFNLQLTEEAKVITEVGCRRQKVFMDYLHQGVTEEQLEMMRLFAERVHENIQNIDEVIV